MDRASASAPPAPTANLLRDFSLSALMAGFVTVLVGFTSSAVIIFQAAHALGASADEISSWMWALGIGMGITCIGLSVRYRMPVVTAWSTPGAAMLVGYSGGLPLSQSIGAFALSAVLITITGFSGLFERTISRIPISLAAGMLAGVLLRFGLDVFVALRSAPLLVLAMFLTYLALRRFGSRYSIIATLAVGLLIAGAQGSLHSDSLHLQFARPIFTSPSLSLPAVLGIALPLFIVTMASQNIPGVAVIRASGFPVPISPTIGWIGAVNLLLAPFGAFALNLAAITAAICMGQEVHEERSRRYMASVSAGLFYTLIGLFGGTVAAVFAMFPAELVKALAGIALLATLGSSLANALATEKDREPALITFLVTASGLSLFGIGSAFWGLMAGILTMLILARRRG